MRHTQENPREGNEDTVIVDIFTRNKRLTFRVTETPAYFPAPEGSGYVLERPDKPEVDGFKVTGRILREGGVVRITDNQFARIYPQGSIPEDNPSSLRPRWIKFLQNLRESRFFPGTKSKMLKP